MAYFLESPSRLAKDAYFSRLLDIIRRPEGATLLKALSQAPAQLAAVLAAPSEPGELHHESLVQSHPTPFISCLIYAHCSSGPDGEAIAAAQLNCVHLIHVMSKLLPDWLPEPLFSAVLSRWRSMEFQSR